MNVFKTHLALNTFLEQHAPASTGLVPTMGALHSGHLSLVKKACIENDWVIVSIFVNPTQFDDPNDLKKYPKTLSADLDQLAPFKEKLVVYAPNEDDLYPDNTTTKNYPLGSLATLMEGASRNGHFQGVATVVHKLFNAFNPSRAYFGEKDFQQLQIIRQLVALENLSVQIVNCPIVREASGLAMSSRNVRLSPQQQQKAPLIYQTLTTARKNKTTESPQQITSDVTAFFQNHPAFELDYFCIVDSKTLQPVERFLPQQENRAFIAVKMGEVRLIDNIKF